MGRDAEDLAIQVAGQMFIALCRASGKSVEDQLVERQQLDAVTRVGYLDDKRRNSGTALVVKLANDGTHVWSRAYPVIFPGATSGFMALCENGDVALAGTLSGALDFDGSMLTSPLDEFTAWVARVSSSGEVVWAKTFNGPIEMAGAAIACGPQGVIVFAANIAGPADFGGGVLEPSTTMRGAMVVAALDSDGSHLFSRVFEASALVTDLALQPTLEVSLVGSFGSSMDLGGGPVDAVSDDAFFARFEDPNTLLWAGHAGDPLAGTRATGVAVSSSDEMLVTGRLGGPYDFGQGPIGGYHQLFLLKLGPDGAPIASAAFGGPSETDETRVLLDGAGHVVLLGAFEGSLDFGQGSLSVPEYKRAIYLAKKCSF